MKKVEIIARLKEVANTKLEKRVLNMILQSTENYEGTFEDKLKGVFKDYSHGCSSGVVFELISYYDTTRFFNRYKTEIIELFESYIWNGVLSETENLEGETVVTLGNEDIKVYDNQVIQKQFNQCQKNILAWFGFEETCYKFNNEFEEIINN